MLGGIIKEQCFGVSFNEVWQGKPFSFQKRFERVIWQIWVVIGKSTTDMFGYLLQRGFEDFEEGGIGRVYINHPAL